ncbi:MAG: NAD(P)/FAD-dependent oxidoreductase [Acidimicrobiales bacterium]|nr:NAD(P)/FAD-dependent oxidoreductase [Acidimicrobiales bacterium]
MTTIESPADDLGFDPDALREKYRIERDKRLRPDGNDQYVEVAGDFAYFVDDPYVDEPIERAALTDEVEVVVIGGGFGGLLAGARLVEAGITDVRIIEKGGDFGGTWYWNRYPGAMCDIESYIYLPLLEETGFMPAEKYTKAKEILAHSRTIGEHYGLYDDALFQTEVTGAEWAEQDRRWIVRTNHDDAIRARFVIMSSGPLHRPKLPGIEGIDTYAGHSFHTSRWDYGYTGGDPDGNLTGLEGKRVGIIGTGATAVQCVPHVGAAAASLHVFQRTPSSIDVRANAPTDPQWVSSLQPGWHRERMENFNTLVSGGFTDQDLVMDGWTSIIGKFIEIAKRQGDRFSMDNLADTMELADFTKMNEIRARVDAVVRDADTAEALKPWYRQFCKRPCFHDEYLDAFNRPNVHLVDTDGRGVDRITERGIVVDGTEYELDCLIFATGFEVGTSYTRRTGMDPVGVDGVSLGDRWSDGVRTMHGMFSRSFPNLFIVSHIQGGFTANYPHMLDEVSTHIAYVLRESRERDATRVEVSEEAEQAWVETVIASARDTAEFQASCTPGYYNNEGQPLGPAAAQNGAYGKGNLKFFALLDEWRDAGDLAGLELG